MLETELAHAGTCAEADVRDLSRAMRLFKAKIAVFVVADDGMPAVLQMHADLVGPAGLDRHVQQAEVASAGRP